MNKKIKKVIVICGESDKRNKKLVNYLDENNFTIIFNPENNRHPKEQIRFIQKEIKKNRNVIITTHSPYILQAIKYYCQIEKIYKRSTDFFWVGNNLAENVNDNLEKVFDSFATPIEKLVFCEENEDHELPEEQKKWE